MAERDPVSMPHHKLRFVFDRCALWFDLAADASFEDVAWKMYERLLERYGTPVGIDVTLTARMKGRTTLVHLSP